MLNDELSSVLARFFENRGPTHDELDRIFERAGLRDGDPKLSGEPSVVGKVKRVRAVCGYAIDTAPEKGAALVKMLIGSIRGAGGFRATSDQYAGDDTVEALRSALRSVGQDLDPTGNLRPALMENLEGVELTQGLRAYVARARTGAEDPELVIGSSKNLEEAVARHVLKEKTGQYSSLTNFPTILGQAFALLELEPCTVALHKDPAKAVQQAIFLLACAVNRLRNAKGDGHGRPESSVTTALEARLASQAAGLVGELLLTVLSPPKK